MKFLPSFVWLGTYLVVTSWMAATWGADIEVVANETWQANIFEAFTFFGMGALGALIGSALYGLSN
jgi:hypothetical protein